MDPVQFLASPPWASSTDRRRGPAFAGDPDAAAQANLRARRLANDSDGDHGRVLQWIVNHCGAIDALLASGTRAAWMALRLFVLRCDGLRCVLARADARGATDAVHEARLDDPWLAHPLEFQDFTGFARRSTGAVRWRADLPHPRAGTPLEPAELRRLFELFSFSLSFTPYPGQALVRDALDASTLPEVCGDLSRVRFATQIVASLGGPATRAALRDRADARIADRHDPLAEWRAVTTADEGELTRLLVHPSRLARRFLWRRVDPLRAPDRLADDGVAVRRLQARGLLHAMLERVRWTREAFERLASHAVIGPMLEHVVLGDYTPEGGDAGVPGSDGVSRSDLLRVAFRVVDRRPVHAWGGRVTIEGNVGVCHPVELTEAERVTFRAAFREPPIVQLDRAVVRLGEDELDTHALDRYRDVLVVPYRLERRLRDLGFRRVLDCQFQRGFARTLYDGVEVDVACDDCHMGQLAEFRGKASTRVRVSIGSPSDRDDMKLMRGDMTWRRAHPVDVSEILAALQRCVVDAPVDAPAHPRGARS